MKHRQWHHDMESEVQRVVDQTGSIRLAAKHFGVGDSQLRRAIKTHSMQIQVPVYQKPKTSALDPYAPALTHLASLGWSCPRMVAALDLPVQAEQVRRWLHSRGVEVRSKEGSQPGEWNTAFVDGLYTKEGVYRSVPAPKGYLGKKKSNGYVLEHRLVMEWKIGRLLTEEEEVHHIDENGLNNDPSNLMLFPDHKSHMRYHFEQWKADYQARLAGLRDADRAYVRSLGWSGSGDA